MQVRRERKKNRLHWERPTFVCVDVERNASVGARLRTCTINLYRVCEVGDKNISAYSKNSTSSLSTPIVSEQTYSIYLIPGGSFYVALRVSSTPSFLLAFGQGSEQCVMYLLYDYIHTQYRDYVDGVLIWKNAMHFSLSNRQSRLFLRRPTKKIIKQQLSHEGGKKMCIKNCWATRGGRGVGFLLWRLLNPHGPVLERAYFQLNYPENLI